MALRTWANVVTQNDAIKVAMCNWIDNGLKDGDDADFIIMASKTFDVNLDQNKKWQIYKCGLKIKEPSGLLLHLKENNLLYEMEDAEWIKKSLDVLELSNEVYSKESQVPKKWRQLPWILQVFGHNDDALFIALECCNKIAVTPSWLIDHFDNHAYISYFMTRQFQIDSTDYEEYFKKLSSLVNIDFLFKHLIGTGVLYWTSCEYLRKVLSEEYYNLAINERLDKLELL